MDDNRPSTEFSSPQAEQKLEGSEVAGEEEDFLGMTQSTMGLSLPRQTQHETRVSHTQEKHKALPQTLQIRCKEDQN